MFEHFPKSKFEIVDGLGNRKGTVEGIANPENIIIPDARAPISMGDELRRLIPNGIEEVFEVIDPQFQPQFHDIAAHFQVKVRKKGLFDKGTGGNYTINVSGNNPRVNLGSTDNSVNTVNDHRVFNNLRDSITRNVTEGSARNELLNAVDIMENGKNDKDSFLSGYQRLISSAANHMTVIAPFLPALAAYVGSA